MLTGISLGAWKKSKSQGVYKAFYKEEKTWGEFHRSGGTSGGETCLLTLKVIHLYDKNISTVGSASL